MVAHSRCGDSGGRPHEPMCHGENEQRASRWHPLAEAADAITNIPRTLPSGAGVPVSPPDPIDNLSRQAAEVLRCHLRNSAEVTTIRYRNCAL